MVKVTYCDRCGKELKRKEKWEETGFDFDDAFEDRGFGDISEAMLNSGKMVTLPKRIRKAQLCQDCLVGYNNIVDKANEEVKSFLKEKKNKPIEKEKKTKKVKIEKKSRGFGWFKITDD